jgi:predicted aspartyl protease
MRQINLDSAWDVPLVDVVVSGVAKSRTRASLVFDTGAALTQLDVGLVERLGYSANDAIGVRRVMGAVGDPVDGYVVKLAQLHLFGKVLKEVPVLTYDFDNFLGLDGLLGWDVIRALHIELVGPGGVLRVF